MNERKRFAVWRWTALAALFAAGAAASALMFPGVGGSRPAICADPPCVSVPDPPATTTTTTTQNRPPTASLSAAPNPTTVGVAVNFAGGGADPDGDPVTYRLEFGDGGVANSQGASHAYGSPGTYGARLVVTDSHGNQGVAAQSIVVAAQPTTSVTTTTNPITTTTTTTAITTTSGGGTTTVTTPTTTAGTTTTTTGGGTTTATTSAEPQGRCFVPSVRGKMLSAATKSLKTRGCKVGNVTRIRSKATKNRVVRQKPKAGSLLPRGARVNLVVSRGRR